MTCNFLLYRKDLVVLTCESCSCKAKTLREEARSRVRKMLLRNRARRESPQADSLFFYRKALVVLKRISVSV